MKTISSHVHESGITEGKWIWATLNLGFHKGKTKPDSWLASGMGGLLAWELGSALGGLG